MTIGACATAGGIQALRNWADEPAWRAAVYPTPEYVGSLATSTPVSEHVQVDAELRGCPIDPGQLLELLTALRIGRRPQLSGESVCLECKRRGNVCVLVAGGQPCLGPLTQTGCGAICPAYGRACYACFGPREQANVPKPASAGSGKELRADPGRPPLRRLQRLERRRSASRPGARSPLHTVRTEPDAPEPHEVQVDVGQLTRVEGEGRLSLTVRDGQVRRRSSRSSRRRATSSAWSSAERRTR